MDQKNYQSKYNTQPHYFSYKPQTDHEPRYENVHEETTYNPTDNTKTYKKVEEYTSGNDQNISQ